MIIAGNLVIIIGLYWGLSMFFDGYLYTGLGYLFGCFIMGVVLLVLSHMVPLLIELGGPHSEREGAASEKVDPGLVRKA